MTDTVAPSLYLVLWTFALLVASGVLGWIVVRWARRARPVVPRIAPAVLLAAILVLVLGWIGAAAVALTLALAVARYRVRSTAAASPSRSLG